MTSFLNFISNKQHSISAISVQVLVAKSENLFRNKHSNTKSSYKRDTIEISNTKIIIRNPTSRSVHKKAATDYFKSLNISNVWNSIHYFKHYTTGKMDKQVQLNSSLIQKWM